MEELTRIKKVLITVEEKLSKNQLKLQSINQQVDVLKRAIKENILTKKHLKERFRFLLASFQTLEAKNLTKKTTTRKTTLENNNQTISIHPPEQKGTEQKNTQQEYSIQEDAEETIEFLQNFHTLGREECTKSYFHLQNQVKALDNKIQDQTSVLTELIQEQTKIFHEYTLEEKRKKFLLSKTTEILQIRSRTKELQQEDEIIEFSNLQLIKSNVENINYP